MSPRPESLLRMGPLPQRLFATGFTAWKRSLLRLCFPEPELVFIDDLRHVPADGVAVAWGAQCR